MKIRDIEILSPDIDKLGTQIKITFENSWGASIIKHKYSYGNQEGLWELAVINPQGKIDYTNSLTQDVLGCLTDAELNAHLETICSWGS